MDRSASSDLAAFESHRALLIAHAYRRLGDLARAEDMVQEAWLRWSGRQVEVDSPRAYLVTLVTRLCLNHLNAAGNRREESRADRLPEPVAFDTGGLDRIELLDQVSMAFLVVLQRLTAAERAVLLLREVFDFDYREIAGLVGKTEAACRKLLERARQNVAAEKRLFATPPDAHRRMLEAFTLAARSGDLDTLVSMLAEDAVMITDGGPDGRRVEGVRNLRAPLRGSRQIASFIAGTATRAPMDAEIQELNGQPALVLYQANQPTAALLLGVADGRIHRVFFQADQNRLRHLGPRTPRA